MEKVLTGITDCEILEDLFLHNGNMTELSGLKKSFKKGLASYVKRFETTPYGIKLNSELSDPKVYKIAIKLANALDKNSINEIKAIKQQYSNSKEFIKAKEYIERCTKEVWDIFDKKYDSKKIPHEAMKTLGITNRPSLEFLLSDSLTFFEQDEGSTTVDIITSILRNENLNYDFQDIFNYLKSNKTKYKYNWVTANFLAKKLDYDESKLHSLGVYNIKIPPKQKLKNFFKKVFK